MNKSWHKYQLPEAFWFQEGPGVRNWQFTQEGIKLLNVGNITKDGIIDLSKTDKNISLDEAYGKYKHFLADAGDLVIASSGISFDNDGFLRTRGAFVFNEHLPLCMNTSTIRFKAKEGLSSLHFLKFWIDSQEFRQQITKLVTGSAQQNFGPSHLNNISINLPSLSEQKHIVTILQKADRLRRLRRQACQLSDTYLQSVFLEMFGDLQNNPRGYSFRALEDLADVVSGVTKGQNYKGQETIQLPYLRVANVQDGYLNLSEIKTIAVPLSEAEPLWLEKGDVLMTEGGDYDKLGRGAIWEGQIKNCIHQNHIFRVRLNQKIVNPLFFESFLLSRFTKSYFLNASKQTTNLASINITQLKNLPVPIPPTAEQDKFTKIRLSFQRIMKQTEESERQTEQLFQSLLQRAFQGEL